MPKLAQNIGDIPASGIRILTEVAWGIPDALMLSVGEPDVAVDGRIRKAGAQAWLADETNYTENRGILPLRTAIAKDLHDRLGVDVELDRITVTQGGTQAIWLAAALILNADDEILTPDPGYTIFNMAPLLSGAHSVRYPLRPENGFLPNMDDLEHLVTPHTRAIILNSPSNPLGIVHPQALVEQLMAFAHDHDLWVISDEVYEGFTYGAPHVSPLQFDPDHRVMSAHSFSKSYAMTGIRIGYLVTPPGISERVDAVQETTVSCVNLPAQYAAIEALNTGSAPIEAAATHYTENAALATHILDELGLTYVPPTGAFYLWVNVERVSAGDVMAWAMSFLRTEHVAVAPGSAFGPLGEGWIRVCLATDPAILTTALRRLPARSLQGAFQNSAS